MPCYKPGMDPGPPELIASDLAPGDTRAADFDWSGLQCLRIRTPDHPLFAPAYRRLWEEFGPRGEMEKQSVIAARLGWSPRQPIAHHALLYEMLVVVSRGAIVAVRDHTAMVPCPPHRPDHPGQIIVHLSHVLLELPMRGTGLAGWLRTFPIQTARECAAAAHEPPRERITLVAEMEHPDGVTPMVMKRLRSYERAGFRKIDPDQVRYLQPDFRAPETIDMSDLRPVPLALIIRRVGLEAADEISGGEVRELVGALYTMFGVHVRPHHMAPLWALLDHYPGPGELVALRPPLQ